MKSTKLTITLLVILWVCFMFAGVILIIQTNDDSPKTPTACAHANAEHHSSQAATCIAEGSIEYWYCADCGKYFADSGYTTVVAATDLATAIDESNHVNVSHTGAVTATCMATGNIEYWHCADCDKYFADNGYTTVVAATDLATEINANNHSYGEYEYDYDNTQYVAVCAHNNQHTIEQEAGGEEYPYMARDVAELKEAIAEGGYVKLANDITLDANLPIATLVTIDLNGKTISCSNTNYTLAFNCADGVITVTNGTITNTSETKYGVVYVAQSAKLVDCVVEGNMGIVMAKGSSLTLNDTDISATATAILVRGTAEMKGGNITSDNQGIVGESGTFTMEGGSITTTGNAIQTYNGTKGHLDNVTISDTTIESKEKDALSIEGTTAVITGTTIKATSDGNAASGVVALAGATVTMTGCTVECPNGKGVAGNGAVTGITMTLTDCEITAHVGVYLPQMDSEFVMEGGSITATGTGIEIRASKATLKGVTIVSTATAEEFSATSNTNGSTVIGAAVAVSQHTTDQAIDLTIEDCTLKGYYALYEEDLENETNRDLISITLQGDNTMTGGVYSQNCANITPVDPDDAE